MVLGVRFEIQLDESVAAATITGDHCFREHGQQMFGLVGIILLVLLQLLKFLGIGNQFLEAFILALLLVFADSFSVDG